MWADISTILAIGLGLVTAVPGLLPASAILLVTWSRVLSGLGWLGFGLGSMALNNIPSELVPGLLVVQAGYGMAVLAIALQPCGNR